MSSSNESMHWQSYGDAPTIASSALAVTYVTICLHMHCAVMLRLPPAADDQGLHRNKISIAFFFIFVSFFRMSLTLSRSMYIYIYTPVRLKLVVKYCTYTSWVVGLNSESRARFWIACVYLGACLVCHNSTHPSLCSATARTRAKRQWRSAPLG